MAGFTQAFADWQLTLRGVARENIGRSIYDEDRANYMRRAQALLKGCQVHFLRSVKNVAQNASLIPVDLRQRFRNLCEELRNSSSVELSQSIEKLIRKEFSSIGGWLDWWMRPPIASKIFNAFKVMDSALDDSLPDTTNLVESQHNLLGISVGQGHQILDGLSSLLTFTRRYEVSSEAVKCSSSTKPVVRVITD